MHSDVLPWLEYRWTFDYPTGMYRAILERLRGTPVRLEKLLDGVAPSRLTAHAPGKWSALENAGHLWNTETLWQTRVHEFLAGAPTLTAADMRNRATEARAFNEQPIDAVLRGFRSARAESMAMLAPLSLGDAARTSHHPRLDREIRLVDLCFFAAEHDDHHLATIRALVTVGD